MALRWFRIMTLCVASVFCAHPAAIVYAQQPEVEPSVTIEPLNEVPVRDDFQLGPTRFQVSLPPGGSRTLRVELTNREGARKTYSITTEDFSAGPDAKTPTQLYGTADGPYSARTWLRPAASTVTLGHGERAFIPVTITVPSNADAGDHYAAVLVQRDLDDPEAQGMNVVSRVGSLFLITVEGPVERSGDLTSLTAERSVYFSLPAGLTLTGRNDGTVHMAPTGTIEIRNLFGLMVDEIPVKDWVILRNATRSLELRWQPRFALGRYRATANLMLAPDMPATPVSVAFWVLPITTILLVLVGIFLVSFLVQLFFSRFEIRKK